MWSHVLSQILRNAHAPCVSNWAMSMFVVNVWIVIRCLTDTKITKCFWFQLHRSASESFNMSEKDVKVDIDDPVYRTTPMQQALASCAGALLTSLFGILILWILLYFYKYFLFTVTPLDVVKIRLQAQQKSTTKCFLYCNGLMDHICECNPNDPNSQWYRRPGHFNGTFVRSF